MAVLQFSDEWMQDLREALGRAHYERMRKAMQPDLVIVPWTALSDGSREAYSQRLDYLVPALITFINHSVPEQ